MDEARLSRSNFGKDVSGRERKKGWNGKNVHVDSQRFAKHPNSAEFARFLVVCGVLLVCIPNKPTSAAFFYLF